jgi:hypothetical protein
MPTFKIPEQNMWRLKSKLDKIQRKINKLGTGFLIWKEVGEEFWKQTHNKEGKLPQPIIRRSVIVNVEGEAPQIHGWEFVGTIQRIENKNILRTIPYYSGPDIPVEFRKTNLRCDHCHTSRRRIDTYLIVKNGEFKQVGRNCLANFLGGLSPEDAANCCTYLIEISETCQEESDFYAGGEYHGKGYVTVEEFLLRTLRVIHTFGWRSRTMACEQGKRSTSDTVSDTFYDHQYWTKEKMGLLKKEPNDEETVKAALHWIREIPDEETEGKPYLWNLKVACSVEYMQCKTEGLVASLFGAYERSTTYAKKKEKEQEQSQYVGEIGKRSTYTCILCKVVEFEGAYGIKSMHKFVDNSGNIFVWFKSGESEMEIDNTYTIKATVKNHDEYQNVKQTILSHCKEE